jgi:putative ABC transport system permease protein
MVTCWAIAPAVAATVIALPAGMALQSAVMHALASDQAFLPSVLRTPPSSLVHVYTPAGLTLLALAGLALTIAGALGPATWAAASRTMVALHAE